MPPALSALLAVVAALSQSRATLHLEDLALRHQLAVDQQTTALLRGSVPLIACSERGWLWIWPSGPRLWQARTVESHTSSTVRLVLLGPCALPNP